MVCYSSVKLHSLAIRQGGGGYDSPAAGYKPQKACTHQPICHASLGNLLLTHEKSPTILPSFIPQTRSDCPKIYVVLKRSAALAK
jgi:hypothetical protein